MAARFYTVQGEVTWLLVRRVLDYKGGEQGSVGFAMDHEKDHKRALGISVREDLLVKSEMLMDRSGNSS